VSKNKPPQRVAASVTHTSALNGRLKRI